MLKTKNTFAFRVFYEAGKFGDSDTVGNVEYKFFGKGFSLDSPHLSPTYGKYGRYNEVRYRLAKYRHYVKRGIFLINLIKRHLERLKKLLGIITTQAIKNDVAYSDETKRKIARIEELLENYQFVFEVVVMVNQTNKKILEVVKKDLKKAAAETFGFRLKAARKARGYLSKDFAKMLEISQNGYSQYENGRNEPPLYLIREMSEHLNVTADWLLGIDKKNQNS